MLICTHLKDWKRDLMTTTTLSTSLAPSGAVYCSLNSTMFKLPSLAWLRRWRARAALSPYCPERIWKPCTSASSTARSCCLQQAAAQGPRKGRLPFRECAWQPPSASRSSCCPSGGCSLSPPFAELTICLSLRLQPSIGVTPLLLVPSDWLGRKMSTAGGCKLCAERRCTGEIPIMLLVCAPGVNFATARTCITCKPLADCLQMHADKPENPPLLCMPEQLRNASG